MAIAPQAEEISRRIRELRLDRGISQRLAAANMGLSRDQLRRIERGDVAVRFFPAWNFCQFTNINPLWLAFGDPEPKHGFVECANSNVPDDATFHSVLQAYGEQYRTFRFLTHQSWRAAGDVFSDKNPILRASFIVLNRRDNPEGGKSVADRDVIQHYLIHEMVEALLNWNALRRVLRIETQTSEAKAELARRLRVTLSAISQWRSGASAPTADKALRLLNWAVGRIEARQRKGAGRADTRAARKTRRSQSTAK
jgi:transcriptional regulator with XRE-family HTH domain